MNSIEIATALSGVDRDAIVKGVVDAIRPLLHARAQLVDGDELAKILGVSRATVDRLRADGSVPSVTIGRRRLYRPDSVLAALERKEANNDR